MKRLCIILMVTFFASAGFSFYHPPVTHDGFYKDSTGPKNDNFVIYNDPKFHSAFPSVIKCANGEYLLAFRRTPERRNYGERGSDHIDPNSQLVYLRSKDGIRWSEDPALLYANPFGGSQDPCLLRLKNGTIVCASYGWTPVREQALDSLQKPVFYAGGAVFQGGYILHSKDNGRSWSAPSFPPAASAELHNNVFRQKVPAYNRGAMHEAKDGRLLWVVAVNDQLSPRKTSNYLFESRDQGKTWTQGAKVAGDDKISFNEASVIETDKGDIVAFLRSEQFNDNAVIARSGDGGKTFDKWESMGFQGHPLQALKLKDGRILLVYGYRHKPLGIRARILNADCDNYKTASELVLREDGGNTDIGYPWAIQLDNNRALVVYYFNTDGKTRHIAGTVIDLK